MELLVQLLTNLRNGLFSSSITLEFSPLSNLRACHYIYQLELDGDGIRSLQGIKNIHHLKISSPFLRSAKGLENITGSLTLDTRGLNSLEELKNIPIVRIIWATYLSDFEGLENHQELHMLRVLKFEKLFTQFQEEKLH
jgi:hypothetical protein